MFHVPGETSDRGALIGVACDLPACRKVCGFLGHCANLGCSSLVEFSEGLISKHGNCEMSQESGHRADVKKIAKSKQDVDILYFDPVRMHLIDPMHNLYLGTAKHLALDILIGRGILTKSDVTMIEQRLKQQRLKQVPTGLGRIPTKTKIDIGTFTE